MRNRPSHLCDNVRNCCDAKSLGRRDHLAKRMELQSSSKLPAVSYRSEGLPVIHAIRCTDPLQVLAIFLKLLHAHPKLRDYQPLGRAVAAKALNLSIQIHAVTNDGNTTGRDRMRSKTHRGGLGGALSSASIVPRY